MSAPHTRRMALCAGAAAVGALCAPAGAFPLPAAVAMPDPDAPLFEALARYDEARAAWIATHEPHDDALERAFAAYPPRPQTLNSTGVDIVAGFALSGRERRPDGRWQGFYLGHDVDQLRTMGPATVSQFTDDGQPLPDVPHPRGEARRREVLGAFDAWQAECRLVDEIVGLPAATQANDAATEALDAVDEMIERLPARTVAGLVAKARWAVFVGDMAGSDGPLAAFAREVAVFGGVPS